MSGLWATASAAPCAASSGRMIGPLWAVRRASSSPAGRIPSNSVNGQLSFTGSVCAYSADASSAVQRGSVGLISARLRPVRGVCPRRIAVPSVPGWSSSFRFGSCDRCRASGFSGFSGSRRPGRIVACVSRGCPGYPYGSGGSCGAVRAHTIYLGGRGWAGVSRTNGVVRWAGCARERRQGIWGLGSRMWIWPWMGEIDGVDEQRGLRSRVSRGTSRFETRPWRSGYVRGRVARSASQVGRTSMCRVKGAGTAVFPRMMVVVGTPSRPGRGRP
jgi:hypothetical protein